MFWIWGVLDLTLASMFIGVNFPLANEKIGWIFEWKSSFLLASKGKNCEGIFTQKGSIEMVRVNETYFWYLLTIFCLSLLRFEVFEFGIITLDFPNPLWSFPFGLVLIFFRSVSGDSHLFIRISKSLNNSARILLIEGIILLFKRIEYSAC